ncbi:hypothetical protein J0S82_001610 [Galemys pyrenaicus]|uniref:Uncharacterized protein n=1 Tax=Galemys pyrenaicus TaxID=202257 RepID=A0A8J5ZUY4_GALPY|nr:hypothetical protein J0S82_001610 [Galemys pyrenaicus]
MSDLEGSTHCCRKRDYMAWTDKRRTSTLL